MTPELTVLDCISFSLENYETSQTQAIESHYQSLSENSLLQIVGLELAR